MSTKITRFRNLLIMALVCFVSGSVWGQETTETFTNATNLSGSQAYNGTEASFIILNGNFYIAKMEINKTPNI